MYSFSWPWNMSWLQFEHGNPKWLQFSHSIISWMTVFPLWLHRSLHAPEWSRTPPHVFLGQCVPFSTLSCMTWCSADWTGSVNTCKTAILSKPHSEEYETGKIKVTSRARDQMSFSSFRLNILLYMGLRLLQSKHMCRICGTNPDKNLPWRSQAYTLAYRHFAFEHTFPPNHRWFVFRWYQISKKICEAPYLSTLFTMSDECSQINLKKCNTF